MFGVLFYIFKKAKEGDGKEMNKVERRENDGDGIEDGKEKRGRRWKKKGKGLGG